MPDDRSEMEAARLAGLAKRHEQRLENATYTAAEVKVLTEAALRLGRKELLDDLGTIRGRLDQLWGWAKSGKQKDPYESDVQYYLMDVENVDKFTDHVLDFIQDIASQPDGAAPEPQADPPEDSDLPQDSQAGRSSQGDVDAELARRAKLAGGRP